MSQVQTQKNELSNTYALQFNEDVHSATCCAEIAEREERSVRGTYINTAINFAQRMRYGEADTSERWMPLQEKKRACR